MRRTAQPFQLRFTAPLLLILTVSFCLKHSASLRAELPNVHAPSAQMPTRIFPEADPVAALLDRRRYFENPLPRRHRKQPRRTYHTESARYARLRRLSSPDDKRDADRCYNIHHKSRKERINNGVAAAVSIHI